MLFLDYFDSVLVSGSGFNQPEEVIFHFSKVLAESSPGQQCPSLKSDNIVSTHHNVMLEIVVDDNHLFTE